MKRFLTVMMVILIFPAALHAREVSSANGSTVPNRLYVFGDSYSDIGEGYLDGNGPTAVAYLARRLGFELHPSTASDVHGKSLDYAVSGAQSGRGEGRKIKGALLGYGMRNQVDDFLAGVRRGEISFDPKTTLFFLLGGLNDGKLPDGTTAANETEEIRALYGAGARHFAVALLTTEIPGFGITGRKVNPSLSAIPATLQSELPGATIRLSRWGMFFDAVLAHPERYGISNTTDACAGRAIFDENTTPCAKPATYFFYHHGHPSTATHRAVGDMLYEEIAPSR